MRTIEEAIDEYDISKQGDKKKIQLIEWFQKYPKTRFDVVEVTDAMSDELDIGQGQIRNHLQALEKEDVLESYGEKRIGYQLSGDIVVPDRYQILAAVNHLSVIFDIRRWGIPGFLTVITLTWAALTFPFWFMWATLFIYPVNNYGPITQSEFLHMAVSMTIWLFVFVIAATFGYKLRRWYRDTQ